MTDFITLQDIEKAREEVGTPKFGPIGWITDYRTYRRWLPEKQRRETFFERNARVVNYNLGLASGMQDDAELKEESALMYEYMNNFLALASGRTMWVGGTQTSEAHPACNFNCSFLAINRVESFLTLFELLMLGTGVGYRVFKNDISNLPKISKDRFVVNFLEYVPLPKQERQEVTTTETTYVGEDNAEGGPYELLTITVGDSRDGWIEAVRILLGLYFSGVSVPEFINFNLNSIRPIGERINGFGGTASGPEALKGIIRDIVDIFEECPEDKLRSIDCMDVADCIAKGVIAGSSRRSALICLFDEGDELCAKAKVDMPENKKYRWQSNNTECVGSIHTTKLRQYLEIIPDASLDEILNFIQQFKPTLEWFEKKFETIAVSGEPGINNYLAMIAKRWVAVREWRPDVPVAEIWDKYCDVGTNPSLQKDTLIHTTEGIIPVKSLQDRAFQIVNKAGETVTASCRQSSENENLWRITLENGAKILASKGHLWPVGDQSKPTSELVVGDLLPVNTNNHLNISKEGTSELDTATFIQGWFFGDGWTTLRTDNGKLQFGGVVNYDEYETLGKFIEKYLDITFHKRDNGTWEFNTTKSSLKPLLEVVTKVDKSLGIPKSVFRKSNYEICSFLAGLFIADGCFYSNERENRVTITTSRKQVALDVQQLLGFLGVYSNVKTAVTTLETKDYTRYDVVVNRKTSLLRFIEILYPAFPIVESDKFKKLIAWKYNYKENIRDKKNHEIKVVAVEQTDLFEDVYDITVYDDYHLVPLAFCWTGNCHEIILSAGYSLIKDLIGKGVSFCNLTTLPLQNFVKRVLLHVRDAAKYKATLRGIPIEIIDDNSVWQTQLDYELLESAVRLSTRIGLRQTCVQMPTQELHETQTEERLLGVSATGWRKMMDMLGWQTACREIQYLQIKMREWANDEATTYAKKLGVPRPLLVTCVKPEGTSSKVFGSSDGLHWEWAPYYIRRIQMSTTDALAKALKDQGFIWHPTPYDLDSYITGEDTWERIKIFEALTTEEKEEIFKKSNAVQFSFPIKAEATVAQGDVSALEQLENVRSFALNYTDHLPSSTVTVKSEEWPEVAKWVFSNWKDYVTAAFLSYWSGNYPLLPYEDISEEDYYNMLSSFDPSYVVDGAFVVDESLVNKYEIIDIEQDVDIDDVDLGSACSTGCPIR